MFDTREPRDVRTRRIRMRFAGLSGETFEPPEDMATRAVKYRSSNIPQGRGTFRSRASWEYNDEIPDPEVVIPE